MIECKYQKTAEVDMRNVNKQKKSRSQSMTAKLVTYSFIFVVVAMVALLSSAFFAGAYKAIVVER